MKQERIQVFVDVVKNYFAQFSQDELVVDTPYLMAQEPHLYHYTGVIGISGIMTGVVYITASKDLLCVVLQDMQESDISDAMFLDLVGEIANTIAGNVRRDFGEQFNISVPIVFKGTPESVLLPQSDDNTRAFVIPIIWKQQVGEIVVCLKD